ncbi:transglutaminase domain-containing protein [Lysobacter sp. K5869]|uniref:transglutaminase-like domain-containing protein n=1 Tax=Lysobacter sp. K5869 TaxID=2820808 RepID=UPI001C05FEE0|nr:transglutaminase domain-containing protein [Lysobacter sp. K5869]QWP79317.1 transglutaminase domain-containing protein [Lysobacter sp. K5869]
MIFALPALVLGLRVSVGPAQAQALAADQAAARELDAIVASIDAGRFSEARAQIDAALRQPGLDERERGALEFQRERMRRIRLDFSLDRAQAEQKLRAQIPDLRPEEFDAWDRQGLFESMTIDGDKRYFQRAPSNLFRLSPQALARRRADAKPLSVGPMETLNDHQREVRDAALERGYGAPRRVRIVQSLTVKADAVPAGKTLRVWLPYPRELPHQQEDIRFVASTPAAHKIAPASTLQRTVYFEQPAQAGKPTRFEISYELTVFGQYRRIDPDKVVPAPESAETRPYLGERAPHIVYTPALREFSRKVVGEETNPYKIAQKLYAAVDEIPWAGAREYSTISNISDYALHAGHADCGQQTLLLMTLLRLNGIPARWQSGWVYGDNGYTNMHDWAWMYLAPYGWLPVDVTTGRFDSPDPQLAGFYLGGLDAYRVAYNDDYGRAFAPAKRFDRSETVDSQRGEVEWEGGNLYFDQWDYDYNARVLPTKD